MKCQWDPFFQDEILDFHTEIRIHHKKDYEFSSLEFTTMFVVVLENIDDFCVEWPKHHHYHQSTSLLKWLFLLTTRTYSSENRIWWIVDENFFFISIFLCILFNLTLIFVDFWNKCVTDFMQWTSLDACHSLAKW